MSDRVLVAVAGAEPERFWAAVRPLIPRDADVELFHVVDEGPRHEVELQFFRRPGRPRPPAIDARAADAERRGSEAILHEAMERLGTMGAAARTADATGRPEREIVRRAAAIGATLVVVAARQHEAPPTPGPQSVSHVARFVVDHAPCPVLLVRP